MEKAIEFAAAVVLIGALAIGLLSMLLGKVVEWWDAARIWWANQAKKTEERRQQRSISVKRSPLIAINYGAYGEDEEDPAPEPHTPAHPHEGAARAHAVNIGADSAPHASAPPDQPRFDGDLWVAAQRIALHKQENPADGKDKTIYALTGARRSGTNKVYQEYSRAWDKLYVVSAPEQPRKFRRTPEEDTAISKWREGLELTK